MVKVLFYDEDSIMLDVCCFNIHDNIEKRIINSCISSGKAIYAVSTHYDVEQVCNDDINFVRYMKSLPGIVEQISPIKFRSSLRVRDEKIVKIAKALGRIK